MGYDEEILKEVMPSWKQYLAVIIFLGWLIFPLIVVQIDRHSHKLKISKSAVIYEEGFLSKDSIDIDFENIRSIKIKQTLLDRILGIGNIEIASSGTDKYEIKINGVNNPMFIKHFIHKTIKEQKNKKED